MKTAITKSWKDHDKLAEHYKAIGNNEIYLAGYEGVTEFPWEFVTHCEPGGSHRLEIATDVWFNAKTPSGMEYRWSFDIEPRSANGSSSYDISVAEIRRVFQMLPDKARESFKAYLKTCATAVRKKADEWSAMVTKQYGTAWELEKLSQ